MIKLRKTQSVNHSVKALMAVKHRTMLNKLSFALSSFFSKEGLLQVNGPNVFKSYWNKAKASKKEFTDGGWFKTGAYLH